MAIVIVLKNGKKISNPLTYCKKNPAYNYHMGKKWRSDYNGVIFKIVTEGLDLLGSLLPGEWEHIPQHNSQM